MLRDDNSIAEPLISCCICCRVARRSLVVRAKEGFGGEKGDSSDTLQGVKIADNKQTDSFQVCNGLHLNHSLVPCAQLSAVTPALGHFAKAVHGACAH